MYYICQRPLKASASDRIYREVQAGVQKMLNRFNKLILHKHILYSGVYACRYLANPDATLFLTSSVLFKNANLVSRLTGQDA